MKTKAGAVTKTAVCEQCGQAYEYKMERTGVATVNNSKITKAEAEAEATRLAAENLEQQLANECDAVACPQCGALTRAMKKSLFKFIPRLLPVIGASLGLCLVILLVWIFTGRLFYIAAIICGGLTVLGIILFLAETAKLLFGTAKKGQAIGSIPPQPPPAPDA